MPQDTLEYRTCYRVLCEYLGSIFLVLIRNRSERLSLVVGFLVGGMLIVTSSTMFANPQVTLAGIFTYSTAGVRPFDGMTFVLMELFGALLAVRVWKGICPAGGVKENRKGKK